MNVCSIFIVCTTLIHAGVALASECEVRDGNARYWKELEVASEQFSFYICELSSAGVEGIDVSESRIADAREAYRNWRETMLSSAIEIDANLDAVSVSEGTPKSYASLVSGFITRVDDKVGYLFYPEGYHGTSEEALRGFPVITTALTDDPPAERRFLLAVAHDDATVHERIAADGLDEQATAQLCQQRITGGERGACIRYLSEWARKASLYKYQEVSKPAREIVRLSMEYSKDWERFYDEGRAQTFIDTAYTAVRYSAVLNRPEFAPPPEVQYFLFRPSVVLEYAKDEPEGDKVKEALAFELYGFNYWDGCDWLGKPCGASLVATYSDRIDVDDYSVGFMLHFDNDYSIAFTRSLGDDGHSAVFFTVDVLKAFEDKKERLKEWKGNLEEVSTRYQQALR